MPRTRDAVTNAVRAIDALASKIADGKLWTASRVSTGLTNTSTSILHLKVPAGVSPVIQLLARTSQRYTLEFYETPTTSGDGTAVTPLNRKRSQAGSPSMAVYHTPTISGNGTLLFTALVPPNAEAKPLDGWVLAPSTNYLIIANNNIAAATLDTMLALSWYES